MKKLWAELDTDSSGHISLRELDADAYDMVEGFLQFLIQKYGFLTQAWTQGFGKSLHARTLR